MQEVARRLRRPRVAIDQIADDGMSHGGEMHANLVRTPSLELDFEQRAPARLAQHLEARAGVASTAGERDDGHALTLAGIAPNRRLDDALTGGHAPLDQREI